MLIAAGIIRINRRKKTRSSVLPEGCSAEEMYQVSSLYKYTRSKIVMAKNGTEESEKIKIWKSMQVLLFRTLKRQYNIMENKI